MGSILSRTRAWLVAAAAPPPQLKKEKSARDRRRLQIGAEGDSGQAEDGSLGSMR
jgi:hypothetical protein